MSRAAALRAPLAIALAALVVPDAAAAHLGHVVVRAERYLKVDATPAEARIVVSLSMGPAEASRVLREADGDENGDVTAAEAEAYLAQWAAGLRREVPITLDGEEVDVEWRDGWLDPIGRTRNVPLTAELVAHVPLEGGEHTLSFRDEMPRREAFDRTDVAFRARDGAELVASGVGPSPTTPTPELSYGPSGIGRGPILLTAVLRVPGSPGPSTTTITAVVVVVVVVVVGFYFFVSRRRSRA